MNIKNWNSKPLLAAAFVAVGTGYLAHADYSSTVLSQGPVGYWRLNETLQPQNTTTAANLGALGASANGIYTNYTSGGLPGPFAGSTATSFDGVSQRVETPWVAGLNGTSFSVEVWASPTSVPAFGYIISSGDMASPRRGWYLAQDDGSTFGVGSTYVVRFFNANGTTPSVQYTAPCTNAPGTWVHLVLTYDGAVGSLYMNGTLMSSAAAAYLPPLTAPFTVGCRSSISQFWPGKAAEVAMYTTALSAARVAAHYNAGMTTPGSYQSTVQADAPVAYYRYTESGAPPAANLGSRGASANGAYIYDTTAGGTGPSAPPYTGFEAANKAPTFSGLGGVVRVPALNLATNTVTISGWFKPNGGQPLGAGLVLCGAGTSASGFTMDRIDGGLSLGYVWAGNDYGIAWSRDMGLPPLVDNTWNYAALVVEPTKATIYVCDSVNYAGFTGVANTYNVNHASQPFSATTVMAAEAGSTVKNYKGAMDEIAIFNRSLSAGELYTQYGSAVGGVPVRIFTDLQGPTDVVALGDPIVLTVDAGGTPPLSFQWRRDGTNLTTTTSGQLSIISADTGTSTYDVVISNGSGSQQSQPVFPTVVTPTQPTLLASEGFQNRTLYPKATLRLSVAAGGGGLKYQWYKNAGPISGATASTYVITSVTNSDAGNYSVRVTNSIGLLSNGPVTITIPTYTTNSYEAAIVSSAPEGWWRLGEPAGSTYLVDGMGRHDGYYTNGNGTVPPVTLGVTGALIGNPNTAATISPTYKGVGVVPYSSALNPDKFTVEIWAKTPQQSSTLYALSSAWTNGGWSWYTSGGYWTGNNAPIQNYGATNAVIPNVWTHLVMTYDVTRVSGGTLYPYQYFVNGYGDAGYIWTGPTRSTGPVYIGGHGVSQVTFPDGLFDGQVDEVAIYPRVLPQAEILAHFNARGVEVFAPSFSKTPLPQSVTSGKSVTFSAAVAASTTQPYTIQWYKSGVPISGATSTSISVANVTMSDSADYMIRVANAVGTNSATAHLTVLAQTSYANVTGGNVLHLRFDGNANDSSGRGNNGTPSISPAPAFLAGIIGTQSLNYTTTTNGTVVGTTSYVQLGAPADLQFGTTTSFTIGLWVKTPIGGLDGDVPFIGNATNSMNNRGWDLGPSYWKGGWQFCFNDGVNNVDVNGADNSINDGAWHHFLVSVDRTAKLAKGYFDGVLMSAVDITALGSVDNNGAPIVIGQDPTLLYPEASSVTLDDLSVWTRALTAVEVAQIESAGRIGGRSFDTTGPTSVSLTVTPAGSNLILNWATGTLLQSDTLGAGAVWTPVPSVTAPTATIPVGTGNKYYRVWVQ